MSYKPVLQVDSRPRCVWCNSDPLYMTKLNQSDQLIITSPASLAMSKDLKQRGFKFVGSTICYAFMQAAGLVDDHASSCWLRQKTS